jgi:TatA/E family protein of Tat protein translocase
MPDKGDSLMFGFIGNIGPWELIFILLIALIVVGPGKLPEVAKGIGKATREFKKATSINTIADTTKRTIIPIQLLFI